MVKGGRGKVRIGGSTHASLAKRASSSSSVAAGGGRGVSSATMLGDKQQVRKHDLFVDSVVRSRITHAFHNSACFLRVVSPSLLYRVQAIAHRRRALISSGVKA